MKTNINAIREHRLANGVIDKPVFVSFAGELLSIDGYWIDRTNDYRALIGLWVIVCCTGRQVDQALSEVDKIMFAGARHIQLWNYEADFMLNVINNHKVQIEKNMVSPQWANFYRELSDNLRGDNHASVI